MTDAAPAPRRTYLDHARHDPMLPEAVAAMSEQLLRVGNASSLHASGRDARRVVEESRERIAGALGCRPGEVVFTSGGTESDNLAVKGTVLGAAGRATARRTRILSTAVEHHAVLDPLHWLAERDGARGRAAAGRRRVPARHRGAQAGGRPRPGVGRRWCR